ncbi:cbb3-type cytochrome oxidase assembly protein CcoS [Flagellimonas nanhaiensis]|uniref:Cbb3-type cytochrome oxidase assembly protein CcoS n=1 Tax=Flagellimonas nanhaiensis TaxID=2292706 RepID=A0A371JN49_9FLAO|nr:cbb3-type cytochrome oxidase assembly protein CcoS [Allomuricauda nanhaiensis]RDY58657.1 cbb3-type cytochrome oxidase assembly protein CcoS [Allomuricauda nanhaiensis]
MSVIYVLLAISITVALAFFAAFVFSVRSGQYDDTYTPSVRMLFEDEIVDDADKTNQDNNLIKQKKSTNQ